MKASFRSKVLCRQSYSIKSNVVKLGFVSHIIPQINNNIKGGTTRLCKLESYCIHREKALTLFYSKLNI